MIFGEILFYLLILALNILLAFFVIYKKKKDKVSTAFFVLLLYTIGWIASLFLFYFLEDPQLVLWFGRLNFAITLPLVFSAFRFSSLFPQEISLFKKRVFISGIKILTFLIAGITLFTPYVIEEEIITGPAERITIYGPLYMLWGFFFTFIMIMAFLQLRKQYKKAKEGVEKKQAQYIFIGLGIALFSGFITNFILYTIGIKEVAKFGGPFALVIFFSFIAYAIFKKRFMDIRVATGKILIYFLSFLSIAGISYLFYFLIKDWDLPLEFKIIGVALLGAILFNSLQKIFEAFAAEHLYYSFHTSQQTLNKLGKKLTRILNLEELTDLITSTLVEAMKLNRAVVLLRDKETGEFNIKRNIGFREENGISLVQDNFLTDWLEKNEKILVYDELALLQKEATKREEKRKLEKLHRNMERIEAKLCLPLLSEGKIIGIIVLGEKNSGDPYTEQDIQLLSNLSNQFSVSLENAKLYSEVEDLSENLEEKVEEQTKQLQEAYEELKAANRVKTEFIAMSSHQLRTPLAAMKGYISMIKEERYGEITEEAKEKLKDVLTSTERLINIVNQLLDISQIELGKMQVETEEEDLNDIVEATFREMKEEGKENGLEMNLKLPSEKIKANIDRKKIEEAIINLIDNSIKYTDGGSVEVGLEKNEEEAVIYVKDTGEGLSEKEKEDIFESFTRGESGKKRAGKGAGLGLHMAQKYITLHNGELHVESEGKDKGATFFIRLPLSSI